MVFAGELGRQQKLRATRQQGVLAMKTATAGTKPCKKCVYILPLNVATV